MAYGLDKQYEKKCASRKILYKDWVASMEEAESSSAGERVEAVFLSDAENGAWADGAKERAEAFLSAHPEVCVVYGDEDVETAPGQYENPWLKPCWSPDTYLWKDYLGEAVAVRKSFYEKAEEKSRDGEENGGDFFIKAFDCGRRCKTDVALIDTGFKQIAHPAIQKFGFHRLKHDIAGTFGE